MSDEDAELTFAGKPSAETLAEVRCLTFADKPSAETLAALTGASVLAWSLVLDDHLVRGTE